MFWQKIKHNAQFKSQGQHDRKEKRLGETWKCIGINTFSNQYIFELHPKYLFLGFVEIQARKEQC